MVSVKNYLESLKIDFKTFTHPPVYTCEEAEKYNKNIKGVHSKNLFVKSKKSNIFYLVILPAGKQLDVDKLNNVLKDEIKFANNKDLNEVLGLSAGAVSPFGLLNDKEGKVKIVLYKEIWDSDFVSFHPNINTETLELTKENFHKYIKSLRNKLVIIQNGKHN